MKGEGDTIAITKASLAAKKRILSACVRLFLERGYKKTTVAEIIREANVSASTFQNIFRAKDGVLIELVQFMFGNQFGVARQIAGENVSPIYAYAVETCIQLTLTEQNEILRDIYVEAYMQEEAAEFIHQNTAKELYQIFGSYQPELSQSDFYELDIGSAGIMQAYMAHRCDLYFTLEKKLERFLTMTMRGFCVPEQELREVVAFIKHLDMSRIAEQVMQKLFQMLAMHFEFSLGDNKNGVDGAQG